MAKDKQTRIREALDELEEFQQERRRQLRYEVLSNADLAGTLSVARRAALVGAVPSVIWFIGALLQQDASGLFELAFGGLCYLAVLLLLVYANASASGLFAFYWFRNTDFSVNWVAFVLALTGDAVLLGWIVILTR